ncbi:MAG: tape measure protein, partial [Aeromonas veronii]
VETIAKAMSVSGATTAEMEGSLVQLSQAFGAGALRGEEFNSVNEAAPRLMQALADSLGVARGQLKSMAAEGQLTTEVLYSAWNGQSKAAAQIQSEFEKMSVTAGAKIAQAQNNLTKWIGENQTAISVTKNYGDAAVGLSNNLDTLADAGTALAAVMGARLAGGLAQAATAKASAAAASRALAVAELNGAKAATTAASAEIALLQAQVATWTQRIKGAATENQASRFRERLAADTALLTGAENSLTAATSRLSAAQAGAAVTGRAMSGAMALLGGPVGVAVMAASAIFAFSSRANEAADPTRQLNDRVRQLTSSMKELSVAEVDKTIGDIERQMVSLNTRMNLAESMDDQLGIKEETKGKIQAELDSMTAMYRKMMEQRKKIMSGGTDQPEDVKFAAISDPKDDKKAKKAEDAAKRAYDAKIAALAREQQAEADDYQRRLAMAGEFNARMDALDATELEKAANDRGQRMIENQMYFNNGLITEEQYQINLTAIKSKYTDERIAIEENELRAKQMLQSSMLGSASGFFDGMAGMASAAAGEQSGIYRATFALSKGFATAKAALDMQMAISDAMSKGFPQNIPL